MGTVCTIVPEWLRGKHVHMVGIKGTGMAALAALLDAGGVRISGSDTGESFYTDEVLERLGIPVWSGFDAAHLAEGVELVIHSPAYAPASNPELQAAVRRGLDCLSYPEVLGRLSEAAPSAGIAGSHGKTTTTAFAAVLCRSMRIPATVLVPSLVPDLDDLPGYYGGNEFFIAETCEFRRHFLSFHPGTIVLTAIDAEHLDYFRNAGEVESAFAEYVGLLPPGGALIYNADNPGCCRVVDRAGRRGDLRLIPYGSRASGPYRIDSVTARAGRTVFVLSGVPESFELRVPGVHNAYNATAALALVCSFTGTDVRGVGEAGLRDAQDALAGFRGSRRRAEIVGEAGGILFMDDYGHHPAEVDTTLRGLKSFFPDRRLVVDFMPHTFSRTRTLFDDFVSCFDSADEVVLHKIYSSARERDDGSVSGAELARAVAARRPRVSYYAEPEEALEPLSRMLRSGDLFVTMGAGDNWKLGRALIERLGGATRRIG